MKLNLACGHEYLKGWINIDNCSMFPDCKPDIIKDIFQLKWDENTVDEIRLSHFMMYVRPEEAKELFKRWFTWLKKDGRLEIETSDLEVLAQIILEKRVTESFEDWATDELRKNSFGLINLFGKPGEPPHRWCWKIDSLCKLLEECGFAYTVIQEFPPVKKPDRDFRVIAIKR